MNNILDYFEKTVAAFPNKIALSDGSNTYSFSELKALAQQYGKAIADISSPNSAIGVFVNRNIETGAHFLGIIYSANYYVPIDPDMPIEKIHSIIEDANISIILGSTKNQLLIDQLSFTGTFLTALQISDSDVPAPNLAADAPLYMVYTSGSTGKPKGVLKSHRAVISFVRAFTKTFHMDSSDVIGNQTPFFFDASAKDFYLMIFTGATLEIIPSEKFTFPVALIEYLNEKKITYICWVPTALALVAQLNTFKKILPEYLKKVFFVGEVFPIKQLRKWLECLPNLQYVNLYGSSEIAGIACYYELPPDISDLNVLPMGKPLCNCEVFLQNEEAIITSPDTIGEVVITSDALALEYFNDPTKTAEKFVTHTTPDNHSVRTFKSGDLAKYDDNHNLIFVTRNDFQIKHMGRRIELGEIESAADKLEAVQRCCCVYDNTKKQIKIYCELDPACSWDSKQLLQELSKHLSDYMQPKKAIILEKMPINANGKIDRVRIK